MIDELIKVKLTEHHQFLKVKTAFSGGGFLHKKVYADECDYDWNAKQWALIAVDEILKVASFYNDSQAEVIYFKEVKQEIKKL